jgi:hypothetical protein
MPLTLHHVLHALGYRPAPTARIVRHRDPRLDLEEMLATGEFETYQTVQKAGKFGDATELVSFVALPGTLALFAGIYRVEGSGDPGPASWPARFGPPPGELDRYTSYSLRRGEAFDDLRGRLVIDWGRGTRAWVQRYDGGGRPIIEVRPSGAPVRFPGFHAIHLSFEHLEQVMEDRLRYAEWHRQLASVAAVYLIVDRQDGSQYVGSATGAAGLLDRWRAYVSSGHGGNAMMKERIDSRAAARGRLDFSVLDVLPIGTDTADVLARERLQKQKLGTRAFGLNGN